MFFLCLVVGYAALSIAYGEFFIVYFFQKLFSCLNLGQTSNMHSVAYQNRQVYRNVYQNEVHFSTTSSKKHHQN